MYIVLLVSRQHRDNILNILKKMNLKIILLYQFNKHNIDTEVALEFMKWHCKCHMRFCLACIQPIIQNPISTGKATTRICYELYRIDVI